VHPTRQIALQAQENYMTVRFHTFLGLEMHCVLVF